MGDGSAFVTSLRELREQRQRNSARIAVLHKRMSRHVQALKDELSLAGLLAGRLRALLSALGLWK